MTAQTAVKSETAWQAESDARTLRDAEEIRSDPARLKRAVAAAGDLYKKALKEAKMTLKITNMKKEKSK